jgi:hypothetical protein
MTGGGGRGRRTGLTVVAKSLAAVEPDWLCIVDNDREACSGRRVFGWDEIREEAASERMAGVAERGLSNGVVLGEEIELDRSTDCSDDVVGIVLEESAFADSDFDSSSRLSVDRCREGGKTKEGIGELHYD